VTTTTIQVGGSTPYDITIGRGLLSGIAEQLGKNVNQILIIHQPPLAALAAELREQLLETYEGVVLAEVPDAEAAKRIEVASWCWQIMGASDFTRSDAVIGLGGGAATDLAGFVASTFLRGIKVVQVPTSVLGVVDAAIGGKTAINTSEGKNFVGTFSAPAAVVIDLDLLATLDHAEVLAGFGEVVKYGFIAKPEILEIIEADVDVATNPASDEFRRLVELSVGVKADIVGKDFKEAGLREILNYGHTLGHAVEYAERYRWRHGAAVALGMMYAAELARLSGRLADSVVDRHRSVMTSLQLPTTYPLAMWSKLQEAMARDKKVRGTVQRFIVLDDLAKPTVLTSPDQTLLYAAFQEIAS
jgi:3-dehydroquinate synthase